MTESFGAGAAIEVVEAVAGGSDISSSVREVTGISYADFQDGFVEYLRGGEDPDRAEVRRYMQGLIAIRESEDSISKRRRAESRTQPSSAQRLATATAVVTEAQALLSSLESL